MKPITIYALQDPRDGRIRYIGKTTDPKRRHGEHRGRFGCGKPLSDWICELRYNRLSPKMIIIEQVSSFVVDEREMMYVRILRRHLLNTIGVTRGSCFIDIPCDKAFRRKLIRRAKKAGAKNLSAWLISLADAAVK